MAITEWRMFVKNNYRILKGQINPLTGLVFKPTEIFGELSKMRTKESGIQPKKTFRKSPRSLGCTTRKQNICKGKGLVCKLSKDKKRICGKQETKRTPIRKRLPRKQKSPVVKPISFKSTQVKRSPSLRAKKVSLSKGKPMKAKSLSSSKALPKMFETASLTKKTSPSKVGRVPIVFEEASSSSSPKKSPIKKVNSPPKVGRVPIVFEEASSSSSPKNEPSVFELLKNKLAKRRAAFDEL